jgi:hypothetical protein
LLERARVELALHAMDQAAALDPALELPASEIAEARALLSAGEPDRPPPPPDGIDYRRGDGVPGYFRRSMIDGGLSLVFAHGPRLILATILSGERRQGAGPRRAPRREDVAERLSPDSVVFETEGGVSWFDVERREGEGRAGPEAARDVRGAGRRGAPLGRLRGRGGARVGEGGPEQPGLGGAGDLVGAPVVGGVSGVQRDSRPGSRSRRTL